jgi:hypothetical protein
MNVYEKGQIEQFLGVFSMEFLAFLFGFIPTKNRVLGLVYSISTPFSNHSQHCWLIWKEN